jgi:hypothetical protein
MARRGRSPGKSSHPITDLRKDRELIEQELFTQEDEQGNRETIETFTPEALISLTVPKLGVRTFKGQHWLGGRFVPESAVLCVSCEKS